jgi:hypothetical protein
MNKKPPIFITAGPLHWGSSRLRSFWPSAYIPGAKVISGQDYTKHGADFDGFGTLILQKIWSEEAVDDARDHGMKVIWDVCDPSWWWQPRDVREILLKVDEVTCSTILLGEDLREFAGEYCPPITYIPDSIEPKEYPLKREHAQRDVLQFVWFGMAINRISLFGVLTNLERLACNGYKFIFTIFDDAPESRVEAAYPVLHEKWRLNTENQVLASMDCAILPPYPGPWGRVKSPNKAHTARMCGLPVVTGFDYAELCRMFNSEERAKNAHDNLTQYYSQLTALSWEAVCA